MTAERHELVVAGPPRTKKNSSRVMRYGKFNKVVPSEAWIAYRDIAVPQLRALWRGRAPIAHSVNCAATFYRDRATGDAVGFYQSIADLLEEAGVLVDDKHIVSWDGSRLAIDRVRPRVVVVLTMVLTASEAA